MSKRSRIFYTCTFILGLTLLLSGCSPVTIASKEAGSSKNACLDCHGPFDKLTSATANYTFPGGEKTTPHRYVDHDSKNIPDCSNCHKPHPVPLTSTKGLAKANAEWCFSCHHAKVLDKCVTCHK
jgi:predicted CXXCH cytochrome family protein